MALAINDTAPDFEAETTQGRIRFHDWLGNSWGVLFSHPKDFTPVCTTELGYMARIKPEFDKRGVKIIGLSVDPVDRHAGWSKDIEETQGFAPNYPMIADTDYNVSKLYGSSMPYAMFFSGGQAVHYSPDFAATGYNGASHGCVNIRDYDVIAWLFDQVNVGDKVIVYWA